MIQILKYLLPGILLAGLIGYLGLSQYQKGKSHGQAVWEMKYTQLQLQHQSALAEKERELRMRQAEQQVALIKLEDKYREEVEHRDAAISNLSNRGLYVTQTRCPTTGNGLPKAENTGPAGRPTDRVRLSAEDERSLVAIADDAQRVVEQYNRCRAALTAVSEIVD